MKKGINTGLKVKPGCAPALYSDGSDFANPANLPNVAVEAASDICDGGFNLGAILLARGMSLDSVRGIVDARSAVSWAE